MYKKNILLLLTIFNQVKSAYQMLTDQSIKWITIQKCNFSELKLSKNQKLVEEDDFVVYKYEESLIIAHRKDKKAEFMSIVKGLRRITFQIEGLSYYFNRDTLKCMDIRNLKKKKSLTLAFDHVFMRVGSNTLSSIIDNSIYQDNDTLSQLGSVNIGLSSIANDTMMYQSRDDIEIAGGSEENDYNNDSKANYSNVNTDATIHEEPIVKSVNIDETVVEAKVIPVNSVSEDMMKNQSNVENKNILNSKDYENNYSKKKIILVVSILLLLLLIAMYMTSISTFEN